MLLLIIPVCVLALCAVALGIMYIAIGRGGVVSILMSIPRTDMMQAQQYEADGFSLPYRIYVPEKTDTSYPVVLFLQGAGHSGTDNRKQTNAFGAAQVLLRRENLEKYPCILIAPQAPDGKSWNDIQPELMGILEQVAANYPADPARVYVTGLSMGGFGTWGMLAAYPDYFAAGVPICGGWDPADAPLIKGIPIWAFHGAKDPVVDPGSTREIVNALTDLDAEHVKYTEYPKEGHWSWGRAYFEPELLPWLFSQSKALPPAEPADRMQAKVFEGLDYRVYAPIDYEKRQYPLVLFLHGAGAKGDDNLAQVRNSSFLKALLNAGNSEKYPCVIVAPQCPVGMRWVPGVGVYDLPDNVEALMALLEQTKSLYGTDPARVYITGLSMGGYGTWGMLRAYPDYFAAAVPVCGGWDRPDDVALAPRLKDVPIWAFHGALDDDVPVECSRDMVEALEAVDGNVKYTEYPDGGHAIWDRVYAESELLPWLFSQVRSQSWATGI